MKRLSIKSIFFLLFIISAVSTSAQTRLGVKLAPVVTSNRVTNDAQSVDNDGAAFKMSVGLIVDKPLSDTYFLSSGLVYIPKKAAFRTDTTYSEEYSLQYLQIPLTLKLFTNEMAPDLKAYFQMGGSFEVKVFEEEEDPDHFAVKSFNPIDFSVILGTGIEYRAGINTTLFGGVSYQRGLINAVNETDARADDLQIRNTVLSIDLGVKF
ncbi:MAG: PorT family protein [Ekhidna sp.]|nr:PorT family protein [Ekhidna sp.]MBC6410738.1 PorT family protein [Ekhidna sp.]